MNSIFPYLCFFWAHLSGFCDRSGRGQTGTVHVDSDCWSGLSFWAHTCRDATQTILKLSKAQTIPIVFCLRLFLWITHRQVFARIKHATKSTIFDTDTGADTDTDTDADADKDRWHIWHIQGTKSKVVRVLCSDNFRLVLCFVVFSLGYFCMLFDSMFASSVQGEKT